MAATAGYPVDVVEYPIGDLGAPPLMGIVLIGVGIVGLTDEFTGIGIGGLITGGI